MGRKARGWGIFFLIIGTILTLIGSELVADKEGLFGLGFLALSFGTILTFGIGFLICVCGIATCFGLGSFWYFLLVIPGIIIFFVVDIRYYEIYKNLAFKRVWITIVSVAIVGSFIILAYNYAPQDIQFVKSKLEEIKDNRITTVTYSKNQETTRSTTFESELDQEIRDFLKTAYPDLDVDSLTDTSKKFAASEPGSPEEKEALNEIMREAGKLYIKKSLKIQLEP